MSESNQRWLIEQETKKSLGYLRLMSKENLFWLVAQTSDGQWSQKEVSDALSRAKRAGSDDDKQISEALALLNERPGRTSQ